MRYEDVSGPLGDEPNDPALYRREADPLDIRPTLAECDQDEHELRSWPRTQYNDGAL